MVRHTPPFQVLIPAHRAVLCSGNPVAHVCWRYLSALLSTRVSRAAPLRLGRFVACHSFLPANRKGNTELAIGKCCCCITCSEAQGCFLGERTSALFIRPFSGHLDCPRPSTSVRNLKIIFFHRPCEGLPFPQAHSGRRVFHAVW
jgi:hypothetical protein